jgi:hypothetical protein
MKYLLIIFCLANTFCFGQQEVYKTPAFFADRKDFATSDFISNPITKESLLILSNKKQYEIIKLNKDFKETIKFRPDISRSVWNAHDQILNFAEFVNDSCNQIWAVVEKGEKQRTYHAQWIDLKNKSISSKPLFNLEKDERLIHGFFTGSRIIFLTVFNKSKELAIRMFDKSGNGMVRKNITGDIPGSGKDKKELSDYFINPKFYNAEAEYDLFKSTSFAKIYAANEKLLILAGEDEKPIHLFTIDLNSFKFSSKDLPMESFCEIGEKKPDLSNAACIFKNKIFVIHSCKEKMELGIFDLASMTLLKKNVVDKNSVNNLAENPFRTFSKSGLVRKDYHPDFQDIFKWSERSDMGIGISTNKKGEFVVNTGFFSDVKGSYSSGDRSVNIDEEYAFFIRLTIDSTSLNLKPGKGEISAEEQMWESLTKIKKFSDPWTDGNLNEFLYIDGNIYLSTLNYGKKSEDLFLIYKMGKRR